MVNTYQTFRRIRSRNPAEEKYDRMARKALNQARPLWPTVREMAEALSAQSGMNIGTTRLHNWLSGYKDSRLPLEFAIPMEKAIRERIKELKGCVVTRFDLAPELFSRTELNKAAETYEITDRFMKYGQKYPKETKT